MRYLKPSDEQIQTIGKMRDAGDVYLAALAELPDGPDKTYAIRKFREVAMWANVTITRGPDGTPRPGATLPAVPA